MGCAISTNTCDYANTASAASGDQDRGFGAANVNILSPSSASLTAAVCDFESSCDSLKSPPTCVTPTWHDLNRDAEDLWAAHYDIHRGWSMRVPKEQGWQTDASNATRDVDVSLTKFTSPCGKASVSVRVQKVPWALGSSVDAIKAQVLQIPGVRECEIVDHGGAGNLPLPHVRFVVDSGDNDLVEGLRVAGPRGDYLYDVTLRAPADCWLSFGPTLLAVMHSFVVRHHMR
eukprot:PhM_4_TR10349/c1_g1_i2/m.23484